jgi:hypothetical protein
MELGSILVYINFSVKKLHFGVVNNILTKKKEKRKDLNIQV